LLLSIWCHVKVYILYTLKQILIPGAARPGVEVGYLHYALENWFTAFSDFERKYLSNFLQFWQKISFKFSPILGENITFFHAFSHFQKYLPPDFFSSRRP